MSLLITLLGSRAEAAAIKWSGSAACRRELEVVEQVESMAGRHLAEVDSADFELELVQTSDTGLRLSLTTVTRSDAQRSTRIFEGRTCVDVTDAAAVAIALTIGSPQGTEDEKPVPLAPATLQPNSATPSAPGKSAPSPSVAAPGIGFRAALSAALDSSATPRVVPGGVLRFGAATARARVDLEGALYAPGETVDPRGEGGTFQLAYVALSLCGQRSIGAPSALICGGYEVGQLTAEGQGVTDAYVRRTLWHGPRAELGLSWPLSSDWSLSARLGGVLPLSRHSFVLDTPNAVHRPGLFSVRAGLGFELKL